MGCNVSDDIQTVTLTISLGEDALPEEVNRATTQLYDQLLQSDADRVEKVRTDSLEAGAKGDPITIGAIALALGVAAAPGVVEIVKDWLARRRLGAGSLTIKLGDNEISFPVAADASPAELAAMTGRFINLLKQHSEKE